jgi:hypothetical protein
VYAPYRGRRITCKAFDIQLRRQDVPKLFNKLSNSHRGRAPQRMMAYRDRYDNPTQFAAAVYLQAQYQPSHKIIAINGISEYDMFSFEGTLNQSFPNIKQILPTPTTTSKKPANQPVGRWNLLCEETAFSSNAEDLFVRLPKLFNDHLDAQGIVPPRRRRNSLCCLQLKGKPNSQGETTGDSGRNSYQSNDPLYSCIHYLRFLHRGPHVSQLATQHHQNVLCQRQWPELWSKRRRLLRRLLHDGQSPH